VSEEDARGRIEAALYAAGRPLTSEELARAAGLTSQRKALQLTRKIIQDVNTTFTAIQVVEMPGERFVMQLKPELTKVARRFTSRALLPDSAMKTLSYVAFFQPISAQQISGRRGPQAYQHLKVLVQFDFVKSEPRGRTRIYRTTESFANYFGLSVDYSVMKQQLSRFAPAKPGGPELTPPS